MEGHKAKVKLVELESKLKSVNKELQKYKSKGNSKKQRASTTVLKSSKPERMVEGTELQQMEVRKNPL